MCGAVTSIPNLTLSGRPSSSFAFRPPSGRTSTALRVRSATGMRASLVRGSFELLDADRFQLVGGLEAEHLCEEGQVGFKRTHHVLRLAKAVPFSLERDVCMWDAAPGERRDDDLRLGRWDDLVVEA